MQRTITKLALAVLSLWAGVATADEPLVSLRVVYVGNAKSPRASNFTTFLKKHFARVTAADYASFVPAALHDADVVLVDWSQSDGDLRKSSFPLGRLEDWSKPTVLLNSAGLLVAAHWQLIGGAG
jgi:hypothetical protein